MLCKYIYYPNWSPLHPIEFYEKKLTNTTSYDISYFYRILKHLIIWYDSHARHTPKQIAIEVQKCSCSVCLCDCLSL